MILLMLLTVLAGCVASMDTGFEGKYLLKWVETGVGIISGSDLTSQSFYPGYDYIEFMKNGTVIREYGGLSGKGQYTIEDDVITITSKGITITATLEGDILRLDMGKDQVFVFEKEAD